MSLAATQKKAAVRIAMHDTHRKLNGCNANNKSAQKRTKKSYSRKHVIVVATDRGA